MSTIFKTNRYGQKADPNKCAASVYQNGAFYSTQCARNGKLEHGGHKWCGQHYPPNVKAKTEKRDAEEKARWAASKEARRKDRVRSGFEDILRLIADGHNDPRSLAQEALLELYGQAGK